MSHTTKDKDYSKGTFGKHKFTVPREAHYLIRYPDGTTETKLLKLGATYEFPTANSIQEIQPVAEQELPNMMCGADRYECQTIEEMNRHMETEHHVERNDLVATYQRPTLEQLESANPTPKEKSISEIDEIIIALHMDGWEKGKEQVKTPTKYTLTDEARKQAKAKLTAREASIRINAIKQFMVEVWGERCKTKDTEDFPELKHSGGRCPSCEAWETYDSWLSDTTSNELKQIERG